MPNVIFSSRFFCSNPHVTKQTSNWFISVDGISNENHRINDQLNKERLSSCKFVFAGNSEENVEFRVLNLLSTFADDYPRINRPVPPYRPRNHVDDNYRIIDKFGEHTLVNHNPYIPDLVPHSSTPLSKPILSQRKLPGLMRAEPAAGYQPRQTPYSNGGPISSVFSRVPELYPIESANRQRSNSHFFHHHPFLAMKSRRPVNDGQYEHVRDKIFVFCLN